MSTKKQNLLSDAKAKELLNDLANKSQKGKSDDNDGETKVTKKELFCSVLGINRKSKK